MTVFARPRSSWFQRTCPQRLILLALTPSLAGLIVAAASVQHTAIPDWLKTFDDVAMLLPVVVLGATAMWNTLNAPTAVTTTVILLACCAGLTISTIGLYVGAVLACLILLLLADPALISGYLASADVLVRLGRWIWQPHHPRVD